MSAQPENMPVAKLRSRPNWKLLIEAWDERDQFQNLWIACKSTCADLAAELADVRARAWKWNLACFGFGLLIGALVQTAVLR
jgi:hypothetical protein